MSVDDLYTRANTAVGQVILAFLGGVISVLMRKEVSTWRAALLAGCGAAFAGFLVAHLCRATGLSDDWTYVFVGVSGWLGAARTLTYLEAIFDARFKLEPRIPNAGEGPSDAQAAHAPEQVAAQKGEGS